MNLQEQAIGSTQGMPLSDGYIAGGALYIAGQQGPDSNGKLAGRDIAQQTTGAIIAVKKALERGGFQMSDIVSVIVYIADMNEVPGMNEAYKELMPDPKPARAAVQAAGLIGGAKVEISVIAVKH